MAQRIVALEIAGDGIRAAVADRAWNSFSIAGTYEDQRRPDEADVSGALTRLINRVGRADICLSALPGELVAKRLLALPFHDRRRLEQAVPFALEEHLPFAVDDSVVAFATVGREGANSLVIAASARKADLRSHLELLAKAGLDPKTVTLSALALPSLVARSRNGSSSRHLLIDLDNDRTSLVFLDADGTPRAIRTLTVGTDSASSGSDPNEASNLILSSIRQTLLAHQDGAPADVILTGAAAALPDIKRGLAEALEVNVRAADELDYSEVFGTLRPAALRFAGCLSMLLGELPSGAARFLNFRQGEFTFRGRVSDFTPLYTTGLIAAAVGILVLVHFFLGLANDFHRLSILRQQINAIAAPALGTESAPDPKAMLISKITEMNKRLHLLGGGGSHGSPLDVLRALSTAIPSRLAIDINELIIDQGEVKLSGDADSYASIDEIKKALSASPAFSDIQVTESKMGAQLNKIQFRLSAALKDSSEGS